MSFSRGLQSAIFYYVACTPCADARYRKKLKRDAQRDKADRDLLQSQMPHLYRHPEPSSTNPHWEAEIALGPTLVRGKRKTPTSDSQRGLKGSATQSSNGSAIPSSLDLPRVGSRDSRRDSKANGFGPVQREDEALWGSMNGVGSGDAGLARPAKARVRDTSSTGTSYRNPALSDLHPATVRKVDARQDIAWMMQPPPTAEVMSGKELPRRQASGSASASSVSPASHASSVPLSRQVSERLLDREISRQSSGQKANGQRHDRSKGNPTTDERDFAEASPSRRERRRPSPLHVATDSEDSAATVIHRTSRAPDPARKQQPRKTASRPHLSTIMSDSMMPRDDRSDLDRPVFYTPTDTTPKENSLPRSARQSEDYFGTDRDRFSRRSAILVQDSSLKVLQDLAPKCGVFNTKIFAPDRTEAEATDDHRLPIKEGDELQSPAGPEMFDSWYTPDFELGKWVHEHTKRQGITKRWSMDF